MSNPCGSPTDPYPAVFSAAFHPRDPTTAVVATDCGGLWVAEHIKDTVEAMIPGDGTAEWFSLHCSSSTDETVEVNWADFSRDGKHIISASADGRVHVWQRQNVKGKPPFVCVGDSMSSAASYLGGEAVSASYSADGKKVASVYAQPEVKSSVPMTQAGGWVAVQDTSNWLPNARTLCVVLGIYYGTIETARFNPRNNRQLVIAGTNHGQVIQVPGNLGTPQRHYVLEPVCNAQQIAPTLSHGAPLNWADWSPNGKYVVTASDDRSVVVWNVGSTKEPRLHTYETANSGAFEYAEFDPKSERIVTASADGYVRVASVKSGDWKCASRPTPPLHWDGDPVEEHWINSARFSGDGKRVISAHETGWVGTWTLPTACDA